MKHELISLSLCLVCDPICCLQWNTLHKGMELDNAATVVKTRVWSRAFCYYCCSVTVFHLHGLVCWNAPPVIFTISLKVLKNYNLLLFSVLPVVSYLYIFGNQTLLSSCGCLTIGGTLQFILRIMSKIKDQHSLVVWHCEASDVSVHTRKFFF